MDTTKEYILMCEKAKEIQKLVDKQVNFSDYIDEFIFGSNLNYFAFKNLRLKKDKYADNNITWLPRQDQLQEMLINPLLSNGLIHQIKNKLNNFRIEKEVQGKIISMEQYLLLIVMKEKYNKVWNGKDWEVR